MSRFFEQFHNEGQLNEIGEQEARSRRFYAELVDYDPPRYRCYVGGKLEKVVYAGCEEPEGALSDFQIRREGVRGEIYSPPQYESDRVAWRVWYVEPNGDLDRIVDEVHGRVDGRSLTAHWRRPDGVLQGYHVYHYGPDDELEEVVTHAADGSVTNRQRP